MTRYIDVCQYMKMNGNIGAPETVLEMYAAAFRQPVVHKPHGAATRKIWPISDTIADSARFSLLTDMRCDHT